MTAAAVQSACRPDPEENVERARELVREAAADGSILGYYRKSHIPDDPGHDERYYFSPGDTGFVTWRTRYATIGIGICWDQWFPECARLPAPRGAEVLLNPTANGEAPVVEPVDRKPHRQVTMQGRAGANMVPVVAAKRVGTE